MLESLFELGYRDDYFWERLAEALRRRLPLEAPRRALAALAPSAAALVDLLAGLAQENATPIRSYDIKSYLILHSIALNLLNLVFFLSLTILSYGGSRRFGPK